MHNIACCQKPTGSQCGLLKERKTDGIVTKICKHILETEGGSYVLRCK